jgi:hypothetical protein
MSACKGFDEAAAAVATMAQISCLLEMHLEFEVHNTQLVSSVCAVMM